MNLLFKKIFNKTIVWIVILLVLSSIFRLSNLDLIEFKSDEATTVYQIIKFFDSPYLISRGLISGTGAYNFPLFNYLMIPLAFVSRDPLFLSGIIAFINSLLVVLFFFMVKKYYGHLVAIFASMLLAFSPWGVIFSRKIWAQDLIFLFMIPFLWLLHELVLFKNTKVILPLFLLLTLLIQLHGSGIFLSITTILILLVLRVKVNLRDAFLGILIGLIPAIPYILFQINYNPFCPDCETFMKYQKSYRIFDFNNFLRPFQIIGGLGYYFVLGKNYAEFISTYPLVNLLKYIFASSILVILSGLSLIIIKKRKYLYLVVYFLAIPFLYFITKTPGYMHYYVVIMPASVLLFAISLKTVYSFARNNFLKISVIAYFLLFLISNISFLTYFYNFLEFKKQIDGDYGPIYSVTKNLIDKQLSLYQNLSYYPKLKSYALIYAQSPDFHQKLGEFFISSGETDLAEIEFSKAKAGYTLYE